MKTNAPNIINCMWNLFDVTDSDLRSKPPNKIGYHLSCMIQFFIRILFTTAETILKLPYTYRVVATGKLLQLCPQGYILFCFSITVATY